MRNYLEGFIFYIVMVTPADAQVKTQKELFSSLPSSYTGVNFRNDIVEDANMFYYKYEYLYIGGGVAIGDINNDGLPDLYFSSTQGNNKLYLNRGNCQFTDITLSAGVGGIKGLMTGVNMIDINNDGFLDILVCTSDPFDPKAGKKILYINNGNLTFTDKAVEYGLDDNSYSTQAYFFDYDRDGDMDLLFVNHPSNFASSMLVNAKMIQGKPVFVEDTTTVNVSNRLYENRNGHFTDVTKKAGLISHAFGLAAGIFDFNQDGWPDIYVANDFMKPDALYINNRNGTFREESARYFDHGCFSSMGIDINDLNNDGLEDILNLDMAVEDPVRQKQLFVLNMNYDKFHLMNQIGLQNQYPHNCVQLNTGNGRYSEIAGYTGMMQTDWSWSPLIADFDNDGWKDVFISNGLKRDITDWDYKEFVLDSIKNLMARGVSVNLADWFKQIPQNRVRNYLFHNNGTLHFENVSTSWSNSPLSFSNGAAYVDLDNDGDLDLVVNNIDDEAFIMRNNTQEINPSHYLRFRFYKDPSMKQEIYGATVKLTDENGKIQYQHYDPQRGYMSTMEHVLHFGTGSLTAIPKIGIRFPSGKEINLSNVKTDQVMTIYESDAVQAPLPGKKPAVLFTDITSSKKFPYTHIENDFIDFKREPLIPYKCSRKGPYYTKADVNGDGLTDIFIGGSAGQAGKLMLQNADGSFTEKKQACFTADKMAEDNGVLFFDADKDGDYDLYVVGGGAEFDAGSAKYQDRLYLNDGKGNFTRAVNAIPKEGFNGSCVIPLDFDGDGYMDLFVGGGVTPGRFPHHDNNILLHNNKGIFTDVTDQLAPDLKNTGIVNDAIWTDIDGDGNNELILAGEWMSPIIYSIKGGKFEKQKETVTVKNSTGQSVDLSLDELSGWWNCMKVADVNMDGKMDILLGNRGMNSRITASIDQPCTIYGKDFDGNGSYDAILGYYIWGKCYPMYHRDQLIDQIPSMRKKFYRYSMYAGKTMEEIFTDDQKKGMDIFKTSMFESGTLINDGNHHFHFIPFPEMAQFSTINDILYDDFDHDGIKDILVCGNNSDADVGTGNYDAMGLLLLKGDGKGAFKPVYPSESGLDTRGEVRRMVPLGRNIIALKNDAPATVLLFQ